MHGGLSGISQRLGYATSLGADVLRFYRVPAATAATTRFGTSATQADGHSAELILEVAGEDGEREFSLGVLTPPLLAGSRLLRALQGRRTLPVVGFGSRRYERHGCLERVVDWRCTNPAQPVVTTRARGDEPSRRRFSVRTSQRDRTRSACRGARR